MVSKNAAVEKWRRVLPNVIKNAVSFSEGKLLDNHLRSFSSDSNLFTIIGTLPAGGQGIAVSQYAEVGLCLSLHRCFVVGSCMNNHLKQQESRFLL